MIGGVVLLCLVGVCTAGTIFEYKDEDKGIHHVQSGEPGTQVAGMFSFNAPEGDKYNLAYTAGEQGFIPNADHLPAVPQDTEDVAAARSSFMEAFMMAEEEAEKLAAERMAVELALDESMASDMSMDNAIEEVVIESARRKRSPVTALNAAMSGMPSYTYTGANLMPLRLASPQPVQFSSPLTYHTYPATYAVHYPYYTYPTMQQVAVKSEEPAADDMIDEKIQELSQAPSLPVVHHPVVRIGFEGLEPVQVAAGQPIQIQPIQQVQVSNERTIQEGDDEPAALAL